MSLIREIQFPEKSLDAFGKQKVVQKTPIINLKSLYGISALRDVTTVAGSGTVTNSNGEYRLQTAADGASLAQLDSAERGRYSAGQEGEIGIGVRIDGALVGNQEVMWGYFDDDNGFGIGINASGYFTFDRKGGVDTKVLRADWNLDQANGAGNSGLTLTASDGVIYHINFSWYGHGLLNYSAFLYRESDKTQPEVRVNSLRKTGQTTVTDPNLPIRVQLKNNGTATAFTGVYVTGRQFSTYGLNNPSKRITSERRSATAVSSVFVPLVTFRRKAAFGSVSCKVEGFDLKTDQDIFVQVRVNGALTAASYGTPRDHTAAETALEADYQATAISGGEVLWSGLVTASGFGINRAGSSTQELIPLDMIQSQPVTICAVRDTADASVKTVFRILEEW